MQIYIFCKALWKSLKKNSCLYRIKILECWVIWTFYYLWLLGDIINPHIPLESDAKYGLTKKEVILNSLKKKMFGVVLKPLFNYYYRYLKLLEPCLQKTSGFLLQIILDWIKFNSLGITFTHCLTCLYPAESWCCQERCI